MILLHWLLPLKNYDVGCLCHSGVTTELHLSRMKSRHGHEMCWMSTGRKNGLMLIIQTRHLLTRLGI